MQIHSRRIIALAAAFALTAPAAASAQPAHKIRACSAAAGQFAPHHYRGTATGRAALRAYGLKWAADRLAR